MLTENIINILSLDGGPEPPTLRLIYQKLTWKLYCSVAGKMKSKRLEERNKESVPDATLDGNMDLTLNLINRERGATSNPVQLPNTMEDNAVRIVVL